MKSEDLHIAIIKQYLNKYVSMSGTYKINKDFSIDIDGSASFYAKPSEQSKIPFKFGKVSLDFSCNDLGLETLENCPDEVGRDFGCCGNRLINLNGSPKKVGEQYWITNNYGKQFTKEEVARVCNTKFIYV